MLYDCHGNKAALKIYKQLKEKDYKSIANWLNARKPRNKNTRDLLRALAAIFEDTAAIDFLSRKPASNHPQFIELQKRADENLDLALRYKQQYQNLKKVARL